MTAQLVHAEWTKLRTVRGWVIALIVAGLLIVGVAMLNHSECGGIQPDGPSTVGGPGCAVLTGPGGEAVTDAFYFVHQPLGPAGTGSSAVGTQTQATAAFDQLAVTGTRPGGAWAGTEVGGADGSRGTPGAGYRSAGGTVTVTGTGDIAPSPSGGGNGGYSVAQPLIGTFAGLIAVIVVAAMFITAEYRRGLIRVTLAASPRRPRVLAAKAAVIGLAAFAVTLPGALAASLIEPRLMRTRGVIVHPVSALTDLRLIAGTAALVAVAAVLAVALGVILRHSAAAVATVIAVIVLPYFFAVPLALLPAGAADWLLRVTPAAGFAIQQPYPAYPQVTASYTPGNGYYPLPPWAGFAVLCAWTALALVLAGYLLRRRDA